MLLVIMGRAGSGKSAVSSALLDHRGMRMLTYATTRRQQKDDLPGEYESVSAEQFAAMEARNDFQWHLPQGGHRYGMPKDLFKRSVGRDGAFMLCVEAPKAAMVMAHASEYHGYDNVKPVFLRCDAKLLRQRLEKRGFDPEAVEEQLVGSSEWEAEVAGQFRKVMFLDASQPVRYLADSISKMFAPPAAVY